MIDYPTLKSIHIACVLLSISGFILRGLLMLARSPMIWRRWVRVFPHIIDTLLLVSGVWLAILLQQYPGSSPWLTAKLAALLLYIGLGFVALRLGPSLRVRSVALAGALVTVAYMTAVAFTRDPILGLGRSL